jgi:hypothetical protein
MVLLSLFACKYVLSSELPNMYQIKSCVCVCVRARALVRACVGVWVGVCPHTYSSTCRRNLILDRSRPNINEAYFILKTEPSQAFAELTHYTKTNTWFKIVIPLRLHV